MNFPVKNRYRVSLVVGLALLLAVSLVGSRFPKEQYLQHAPMLFVLPLLFVFALRSRISNASMTCLVSFLVLHVIGARYIYSFVPGGDRLSLLSLGGSTGRNNYDRLVHLAFGLLLFLPATEWSIRRHRAGPSFSRIAALCLLMGASALYEIFEWLLTVLAAPEYAESYNGQQGDLWDAQKDMGLAMLGAVIAWPAVRRVNAGPANNRMEPT